MENIMIMKLNSKFLRLNIDWNLQNNNSSSNKFKINKYAVKAIMIINPMRIKKVKMMFLIFN